MTHAERIFVSSGALFVCVFLAGFFLSIQKPLWLDEHWSLTSGGICHTSYGKIFSGQNPNEANNSPLFYSSQKFLCDLVSYDPGRLIAQQGKIVNYQGEPVQVYPNVPFYDDPFSNAYLRLISIFLMALAPAALLYYFALRYSWFWGIFSALLCLSAKLFWWYGLEARPYIHFFTFTTLQMLVFLELIRKKGDDKKVWAGLAVINVLLALTFTVSIFQIIIIGICVGSSCARSLNWQRVLTAFFIPAAIVLYYHFMAIQLHCAFYDSIPGYYLSVIPTEVLAVAGLFLIAYRLNFLRRLEKKEIKSAAWLFILIASLSVVYLLLMLYLKSQEIAYGQGGSPLISRHFINLVPVGIVAMTVFSRVLVLAFARKQVQIGVLCLLMAILALRFLTAYNGAHYWIGSS